MALECLLVCRREAELSNCRVNVINLLALERMHREAIGA